jgi:hypothetical protein
MATAGKKKILIALQKPTLVLGNAEPMDTIHRTISRGYAVGPVRGRWIVGGVLGSCMLGVAAWWTATQIWCTNFGTLSASILSRLTFAFFALFSRQTSHHECRVGPGY